jgi:hypothetical protein
MRQQRDQRTVNAPAAPYTADIARTAAAPIVQLKKVRKARAVGVPMHLIAHEDVLIFAKALRACLRW